MPSLNIHRNDTVKVLTGSDRGKTGRVLRVFPDKGTVLVEHVRMVKKTVRASRASAPRAASPSRSRRSTFPTCMLVCPNCGPRAWATRSKATPRCACARSAGRRCPPRSNEALKLKFTSEANVRLSNQMQTDELGATSELEHFRNGKRPSGTTTPSAGRKRAKSMAARLKEKYHKRDQAGSAEGAGPRQPDGGARGSRRS